MKRYKILLTADLAQRQAALELIGRHCDEHNPMPKEFANQRWIGFWLFVHDGACGVSDRSRAKYRKMLDECQELEVSK
jgi:hypothetical protein